MSIGYSIEVDSDAPEEGRFELLLASLDAAEVELVARIAESSERLGLTRVAGVATRLGNGWLYPGLSLFLVLVARIEAPLRFLAASALSLSLVFSVYPVLKTLIARARPCDYDPSLARGREPLDHYSCPSGHAMTAAAFAVPVMFACSEAAAFALAVCVVIGWSRVALGHHYVSDIVIGTVLGAGVATGVSAALY
jgi:undecaprenyl-diphosphatase